MRSRPIRTPPSLSGDRPGSVRTAPTHHLLPAAAVQGEQLAENLVVGDVRQPTVRGGYRRVKSPVRLGQPLWPGVVEVRQRALLSAFAGASSRGTSCFG